MIIESPAPRNVPLICFKWRVNRNVHLTFLGYTRIPRRLPIYPVPGGDVELPPDNRIHTLEWWDSMNDCWVEVPQHIIEDGRLR